LLFLLAYFWWKNLSFAIWSMRHVFENSIQPIHRALHSCTWANCFYLCTIQMFINSWPTIKICNISRDYLLIVNMSVTLGKLISWACKEPETVFQNDITLLQSNLIGLCIYKLLETYACIEHIITTTFLLIDSPLKNLKYCFRI
jgi:hypothetical protein